MFDMEYISKLLQNLLLAILPILAAQGVAILIAVYKSKRAEMTERQQWILDNAVRVAVVAAEQLYKAGNGDEKKAYALQVAENWIAEKGLTVDLHLLEAQIEAAVFEQFNRPLLPG
jgi:hypothetical protein